MSLFLSYSRQDFPFASGLYRDLKAAGLEPWLDVVNIPSGTVWQDEVQRAIETCSAFVLVATPASLRSYSVREEWRLALEKGKPVLMLMLQGVPEEQARDALDEVTAELDNPPLQWVDVRNRPLQSARLIHSWLKGELAPQHGMLPMPATTWLKRLAEQPRSVQLFVSIFVAAALTNITGGLAALGWLINQPLFSVVFSAYRPDSILGVNVYLLFLLARAFLLALPWLFIVTMVMFAVSSLRRLPVIVQRQRARPTCLGEFFLMPFSAAGLVFMLPFANEFLGFVTSVYVDQSLPSFATVSALAIGILILFIFGMLFAFTSRELARWFPAFSGQALKDDMPYSQNGFMPAIRATAKNLNVQPGQSVCLLYAQRDAPLGEFLESLMKKQGYQTRNKLSLHEQAVILVISPWAMRDEACEQGWQRAVQAGIPLIPLLLEPTGVPPLLRRFNWIDAQSNFNRMSRNLLNTLQGKPEPQIAKSTPTMPSVNTREGGALPGDVTGLMLLTGLVSPVLLWLAMCLLVPLSTWRLANLNGYHWLAFITVLAVAYLQFRLAMIFADRRMSRHAFFAAYVAAILIKFLLLSTFWRQVAFALWQPLESLPLITAFTEMFFGLWFVLPDVRRWAPAGWWLGRGYHQRQSEVELVLAVLFIGLIAPTWFGGNPQIQQRSQGESLDKTQSLLVRFPDAGGQHQWQISVDPGSVGMVILEPVSDGLTPTLQVQVPAPARTFSVSGYWRTAYIYAGGNSAPLNLTVSAPEPGGVYQLLVRTFRVMTYSATCTAQPWQQEVKGNWRGYQVSLSSGQTLTARVHLLGESDTISWLLFNPLGEVIAGDPNDNDLANLSLNYRVEQAGEYALVVITSGRYQVEIECK